jgi:ABC-type lipoprotein release transport system permease subunit
MAIMIALPAGIAANQAAAENLTSNLGDVITQTQSTINQTLTQIECSLTPSMSQGPSISSGPSSSSGGPTVTGPGPAYGGGQFGGGESKPMNASLYSDVARVSNVAAVVPVLQVVEGHNVTEHPSMIINGVATETGESFNVTVPDYIINGIALDSSVINSYPVLPTNITAGRNLLPGETGKVVLSENSSAYFGKGVGDTVSILGEDFEVVGIYGPTGVADKQLVYMNIADAQAITNSTGIVTSLKVFAKSSDVVSSVANDISALHPELSVNTAQERLSQLQQMQSLYNAQLENAKATMNQTQAQANGETLIAVTATSVIVLFVMLYTVRERTKEIGTLKAIGASNGTVMSQFLVEGILLSLLAGVVGVAIGIVAAPALSSVLLPAVGGSSGGVVISTGTNTAATTAAVAVTPELIMIGLAVSVVLGAIGSLYPAWRAAKIRPAEAMRYE